MLQAQERAEKAAIAEDQVRKLKLARTTANAMTAFTGLGAKARRASQLAASAADSASVKGGGNQASTGGSSGAGADKGAKGSGQQAAANKKAADDAGSGGGASASGAAASEAARNTARGNGGAPVSKGQQQPEESRHASLGSLIPGVNLRNTLAPSAKVYLSCHASVAAKTHGRLLQVRVADRVSCAGVIGLLKFPDPAPPRPAVGAYAARCHPFWQGAAAP